jgi:pimeloyl-ACP methyl ester carboxylesterase
MKERVVSFGKANSLVGILTDPPRGMETPSRPAVIMLNSGVLHRVGASRIHVSLARALAAQGFCTLRFDFSGIGDSEPRRDSLSFIESAPRETQDAMDRVESLRQCSQFILLGLCSGADVAFLTAPVDRRVVGMAVLDPVAYRTPRFYVNHYAPRLLDAGAWKRFAQRQVVERLPGRRATTDEPPAVDDIGADDGSSIYVREFPPQEKFGQDLSTLIERGVRQLFVYTDGMTEHCNYSEQLQEAFPHLNMRDTIGVHYWPDADHTFTGLPQQQRLVETVTSWAASIWAPDARDSARPQTTAVARV